MRRFWSPEALSFGLIYCLLAFAPARALFGQAAGASISGRVTDSTGAGIPEAPVTVKNSATSAIRSVTTDAQGRYLVPDLAIGTYEVSASKMGF
jgi:hypothetical protein